MPLYAQLPPAAQAKIFTKVAEMTRRVVIATNIAETSMTIPGVSYVVDTGYKKEKEYIYRSSGGMSLGAWTRIWLTSSYRASKNKIG